MKKPMILPFDYSGSLDAFLCLIGLTNMEIYQALSDLNPQLALELIDQTNANYEHHEVTLLETAIVHGYIDVALKLLNCGAVVCRKKNGIRPLTAAVQNGDIQLLTRLVQEGANVKWRDSERKTLLMIAVLSDITNDTMTFLIDNGVKVNAKDNHGFTALMYAIGCGATNAVRQLVRAGADI